MRRPSPSPVQRIQTLAAARWRMIAIAPILQPGLIYGQQSGRFRPFHWSTSYVSTLPFYGVTFGLPDRNAIPEPVDLPVSPLDRLAAGIVALLALGPAIAVEDQRIIVVTRELFAVLVHDWRRNTDRGREVALVVFGSDSGIDQEHLMPLVDPGLKLICVEDLHRWKVVSAYRRGAKKYGHQCQDYAI